MSTNNQKITIDLLKFYGAAIIPIQGAQSVQNCIVIPVDLNDIKVIADEATSQPQSARLYVNAWELKSPSRYGDTHLVKQSFSKDFAEQNEEYVKNTPILGNMRPMEAKQVTEPVAYTPVTPEGLPF